MNKRERYIEILYHRKSDNALLYSWVCISGATFRSACDAVELKDCTAAALSKTVVALFKECSKADIDKMKEQMEVETEVYRKSGTKAWSQLVQKSQGPTYKRLLKEYPSLAKGPAATLRQFTGAELHERPGQKSRRLIRVKKSSLRSSTEDGETVRLPLTLSGKKLGQTILDFLAES